jgi:hypothetical protein
MKDTGTVAGVRVEYINVAMIALIEKIFHDMLRISEKYYLCAIIYIKYETVI